jgi:hypothetical protein
LAEIVIDENIMVPISGSHHQPQASLMDILGFLTLGGG